MALLKVEFKNVFNFIVFITDYNIIICSGEWNWITLKRHKINIKSQCYWISIVEFGDWANT